MREVIEYVTRGYGSLQHKPRVNCNDKDIMEKVWVSDLCHTSDNTLYSGCYVKRWYHCKPKLRLMTTNKIVETKQR
jgi:hypothetical protein